MSVLFIGEGVGVHVDEKIRIFTVQKAELFFQDRIIAVCHDEIGVAQLFIVHAQHLPCCSDYVLIISSVIYNVNSTGSSHQGKELYHGTV